MNRIAAVIISTFISQVWTGTIYLDNRTPFEEFEFNEDGRLPSWFLIFPGTKWCGAGNISENEDDLGSSADTDKCCRTHDYCDDIIEGHETSHNLTNDAFYTRLNCECDDEFYKCLKDVDSKTSSQVGFIYFNLLGTKCFREDYPIVECKKYIYTPRKKCVEYEYDTTKNKHYQWFDVPKY
ncbi:hypothetical protein RI129_010671 [Pyrocoelia pectoralis]|uniref:Phospholipase A2 n=1 Tax=Pyrocoelia pectoralis TaxID=417401 RepID=A0AAN7Z8X2_9COLE